MGGSAWTWFSAAHTLVAFGRSCTPSESLLVHTSAAFVSTLGRCCPCPAGLAAGECAWRIQAVTAPICAACKGVGQGRVVERGPRRAAAAVAAETIVGKEHLPPSQLPSLPACEPHYLHTLRLGDFIYELKLKSTEAGAKPPSCALHARWALCSSFASATGIAVEQAVGERRAPSASAVAEW